MTYGLYDSDLEVGALSGSYDTRILGGKAKLYGQYQVGEYFLRPEAAISYARIESDGFDLSGNIIGRQVTIDFVENNFNAGLVEASTEFSRQIDFGDGKVLIPFTEIGVQYAFDRPNDGKILTGNFFAGAALTLVRIAACRHAHTDHKQTATRSQRWLFRFRSGRT